MLPSELQFLQSIPHFKQCDSKSCLPAAVRIVLASQGLAWSETLIARILGTREEGTPIDNVERLLIMSEISAASVDNCDAYASRLEDNNKQHYEEAIPFQPLLITFLWTGELSNWRIDTVHAVVIAAQYKGHIYVFDPYFDNSPLAIPLAEFQRAWREMDYLGATISVKDSGV